MNKFTLTVAAVIAFTGLMAQMPNDGIFLVKGELCAVTTYHHNSWKKYWEGERLRENSNLGTIRTQAIMPMVGYGITDKINVFAGLPYIWTKATAGTMAGQRGWQDFSIGIKGKFYEMEKGSIKASVQGFAGYSLPVTNYVADYLPFSIGLQSKVVTGRALLHVQHTSNLHATATWAYNRRSNITIDANTYYDGKLYYTDQVYMHDVVDYSVRVGYNPDDFLLEAYFAQVIQQGGGGIRRELMPSPPSMNMTFNRVGLHGIYRWGKAGHFQTTGGIGYTLSGINVGKALDWYLGVMYVFNLKKSAN